MKTIYILLSKSNTVVSRMVGVFTADEYTHVSISFDKELTTFYSSSRKNGRTMFPAGPCRESFRYGWFKKYGKIIPCALYKLEVCDEVYAMAKEEVEKIMQEEEKYHYNIFGLILCKFNIPFERRNHFFCSQFVGEILERSHALELPKVPTVMKPCDYMNMPELDCVYTGYIEELSKKWSYAAIG